MIVKLLTEHRLEFLSQKYDVAVNVLLPICCHIGQGMLNLLILMKKLLRY